MRVDELRKTLRGLGLPTTGSKSELEARLLSADPSQSDFGEGHPPSKRHKAAPRGEDEAHGMFTELAAYQEDYKEGVSSRDVLDASATLELCNRLGVDPEDAVMIGLSLALGSPSMGRFQRAEFVRGCLALRVRSFEDLKRKLPELREKYSNSPGAEEAYRFAYAWACEPGQRVLSKDVALELWRLLFPTFADLQTWLDFLSKDQAQLRGITKDVWISFGRLVRALQSEPCAGDWRVFLAHASPESGSWPTVMDDFFDVMRSKVQAKPA